MIAEPIQPASPPPAPDPCAQALVLSSPSPALSDTDRALLFAYFDHHENLAALAAHLASEAAQAATLPSVPSCLSASVPSPDYFSLLTWLNQPHIQQALEAHDAAVARADRHRALDAVRQFLDTADNPTNLRRAATTLLRSAIVRPARACADPDAKRSPRRGEARNAPAANNAPALQHPQSKVECLSWIGSPAAAETSLPPVAPLSPLTPPLSCPTPIRERPPKAENGAASSAPQPPLSTPSNDADPGPADPTLPNRPQSPNRRPADPLGGPGPGPTPALIAPDPPIRYTVQPVREEGEQAQKISSPWLPP